MSYRYQTISKKETPEHKTALMDFFKRFRYIEDYSLAIDNSTFICVCWLNNEIVGAGRVISDLSRFGFIVDLNVRKTYQNQGIGKKLVLNMVQACLDANVRFIELSTDPSYPWLKDFYKKIGFHQVKYSDLMEWPRRR